MDSTLQAGSLFGRYKIIRLLGRGGMADVYLAEDTRVLNRRVALKVLSALFSRTTAQNGLERFKKEIEAVIALDHPHIVTLFDVGQEVGLHYYSMSYIEGGDLRENKINSGFSPEFSLRIMRQIATSLQYAEKKGIVHRDIKPENILLNSDGDVFLSDFGIARAISSTTSMTQTGTSIGTPHYMSPEQACGKKSDNRSDLYSLGIVFYEMLIGCVPFEAENSIAVVYAHIHELPPRLPEHLSLYQPLLDKLLAKKPEDRFQMAKDLVDAIDKLSGNGALSSGSHVSTSNANVLFSILSSKFILTAIGVISIAGVAFLFYSINDRSNVEQFPVLATNKTDSAIIAPAGDSLEDATQKKEAERQRALAADKALLAMQLGVSAGNVGLVEELFNRYVQDYPDLKGKSREIEAWLASEKKKAAAALRKREKQARYDDFVKRAEQALSANDLKGAESLLAGAEEVFSGRREVLALRDKLDVQQKKEAENLQETAKKTVPTDDLASKRKESRSEFVMFSKKMFDDFVRKALSALKEDRLDQAEEFVKQAEDYDADNVMLKQIRDQISKKRERALLHSKNNEKKNNEIKMLTEQIVSALKNKELKKAESLLDRLASVYPGSIIEQEARKKLVVLQTKKRVDFLVQEGKRHESEGRYGAALQAFQEALSISPSLGGLEEMVAAVKNKIAETERKAETPKKLTVLGIDFVWIDSGCFERKEKENDPLIRVCLDGFWMGEFEITNEQFRQFRPSHITGDGVLNDASHPVANVTWNDAADFARWIDDQSGKSVRLPTEAEWEFAAKANSTNISPWGNTPENACSYANIFDKKAHAAGVGRWKALPCEDGFVTSSPVGRFPANAYGLHDMLGNVFEWCSDWLLKGYYAEVDEKNPAGPSSGEIKVFRGGSWRSGVNGVSYRKRNGFFPSYKSVDLGIRFVIDK